MIELWQVFIAAPIAISGGIGALLLRTHPKRLGSILVGFLVFVALMGTIPVVRANAGALEPEELSSILRWAKYAAVVGLVLILGSNGLIPKRQPTPPAV